MGVPRPHEDLSGRKFGELEVIEFSGRSKNSQRFWRCRCVCGVEKEVYEGALRAGGTKSCGCRRHCNQPIKHGEAEKTPEYRAWAGITKRCCRPKNPKYPNYGGRGITMCSRWRGNYLAFLEDMGRRPSDKHSLDRIDNNKGYYKENCAWRTAKEQHNNKRTNRWIELDGEVKTAAQWEEVSGIKQDVIRGRLRLGWTIRDAIRLPVKSKNSQVRVK